MIRFRIEDQATVRSVEIVLDHITVGRAMGCHLSLRDQSVGRYHASLRRDGTELVLVTSGRGQGTYLNGHPVEESATVRVGDRMTFGKTHVTLEAILPGRRLAGPAPAVPHPPPAPPPPPPPAQPPGPPPPPHTALAPPGSSRSFLERTGVLRIFHRGPGGSGAPPSAPGHAGGGEEPGAPVSPASTPAASSTPAPVGAPSISPAPVGASSPSVGFTTEMLRAPGSSGEEEARALRRILEVNKRLARVHDEDRLLDLLLDGAADLTGAARGLVLLPPAEEGGEPRVRRELGGVAADREAWTAAARRVLSTGRAVALEGDGGEHRALLCVPLRAEKGILGLLFVDRHPGDGPFPPRAAVLLEAFSDQASLAIQTAALLRADRERGAALEAAGRRLAESNAALAEALRARTVELQSVREEAIRAREGAELKHRYERIVGRSAPVRTLLSLVDKVTESAVPVLIEGESGTGKELVARAIHHNGARSGRPFVVENCAAVPDALIENELFGHERGAFTGADRAADGLFERADGGTLFLDEVGDMSPEMQKKLLRVLQEGEVRRVGGKTVRKVDVRVLCATNRDLARMVKEGRFREDLFYRLCVVRVRIPPLRERREDIPLLAVHFLDRIAAEAKGEAPRLEAEALDALTLYGWPGNVRELENEIRRAATLAGGVITRDVLSPHVREAPEGGGPVAAGGEAAGGEEGPGGNLKEAVEALERRLLRSALAEHGGNRTRTAGALGLSRLGLRKKMTRYGIDG